HIGERIRDILLDNRSRGMHAKCEVLLFLAARSQMTYEIILPALREKKIVVTDRFADSTLAYQCHARGLPQRLISVMNRFAAAGLKPDLTFLIDIDVEKRKERGKFEDRMETEAEGYHRKVRRAYETLAGRSKKRFKVICGEMPINVVHAEVIRYVEDILSRKGYRL
ncbi:MAG: dTMP kinase, partial [candidate division WOR-3 bacterium]